MSLELSMRRTYDEMLAAAHAALDQRTDEERAAHALRQAERAREVARSLTEQIRALKGEQG